jgi:hypothetical protein
MEGLRAWTPVFCYFDSASILALFCRYKFVVDSLIDCTKRSSALSRKSSFE